MNVYKEARKRAKRALAELHKHVQLGEANRLDFDEIQRKCVEIETLAWEAENLLRYVEAAAQ